MVGLVTEAKDEAGSMDAMLLRIEGIETRDKVRKGHEGGDSGEVGLDSSWATPGAGGACSSSGLCAVEESAPASGDLFTSEHFLSLPLPKTVFRRDPFLFRFAWA